MMSTRHRVWRWLEWLDAVLLHCRVHWFCTWLIYSEFWRSAREEEDRE
jgi:hypothetical protein